MKFVRMSHPRTAVLSVTDSAPKSQNRNAGMLTEAKTRVFIDPIHRDQGSERPSVHYSSKECLSAHVTKYVDDEQCSNVGARKCAPATRQECTDVV